MSAPEALNLSREQPGALRPRGVRWPRRLPAHMLLLFQSLDGFGDGDGPDPASAGGRGGQLLQHYWLGHRLGLTLYEWFALETEIILSFLRLHPSTAFWTLLLTMMATPFLLRDLCPL